MDPWEFAGYMLNHISKQCTSLDELKTSSLAKWMSAALKTWHVICERPIKLLLPASADKLAKFTNETGVILPDKYSEKGFIYIFYEINGLENYSEQELQKLAIETTLQFGGVDESIEPQPLASWNNRRIQPCIFSYAEHIVSKVEEVAWLKVAGQCLVICLPLAEVCAPEGNWKDAEFDGLYANGQEEEHPEIFPERSKQILKVELKLIYDEVLIVQKSIFIEIGNLRSFYFMQSLQDYTYRCLAVTPLFDTLSEDELRYIVTTAHPIALKPYEQILAQGAKGSSLFFVLQGYLDAYVRAEGSSKEKFVGHIYKGESFGEVSLLTGARRSANVYATSEGAVVLEISKQKYQKILDNHPELLISLAKTMKGHLSLKKTSDMPLPVSNGNIFKKIKKFFFRSSRDADE